MNKIRLFMLMLVATIYSFLPGKYDRCNLTGNRNSELIASWIHLHLQLIRHDPGLPEIVYSRHFASSAISFYEVLQNGNRSYQSVAHHLNGSLRIPGAPEQLKLNLLVSANSAVAEVLRYYYSNGSENSKSIDSLEQVYFLKFQKSSDEGMDLKSSVLYGKQVAKAVIEWSNSDGSERASVSYTPESKGSWISFSNGGDAAVLPGWGNNRTIIPGSLVNSQPSPAFSFSTEKNSAFYRMANDVFETSRNLSKEQMQIARYWEDRPNGKLMTVFGHWSSILEQILKKENTPLMKGAVAYLKLAVSMNDAAIGCWKTKYRDKQISPEVYIRKYMDKTGWLPVFPSPLQPEYPSAHSVVAASAASALQSEFGWHYSFQDTTYLSLGLGSRKYGSFKEAAVEAGISGFYAGIQFRPSIDSGLKQGWRIGNSIDSFLNTRLYKKNKPGFQR